MSSMIIISDRPDEVRNFRLLETGLVLLALLLIGTSVYLFSSGTNLRRLLLGWQDTEGKEPVGLVLESLGETRRKSAQEIEFQQAQSKEVIHNFDTILTGDSGSISLKLKDGSEITLGPRTMVRVVY